MHRLHRRSQPIGTQTPTRLSLTQVESRLDIAFVPLGAARRCGVIWRRANTLGIRFIG